MREDREGLAAVQQARESAARDAGARLDRDGVAEMIWLGAPGARATTRFPVWALDGCGKRCARRWLEQRDVPVARSYVVA